LAGNYWPRKEALALLKIRPKVDAAFREAALALLSVAFAAARTSSSSEEG
jgi:hypothetical protein